MKKAYLFSFAAIVALFSCEKKEDNNGGNPTPVENGITMGFKVTGTPESEYVLTQKEIMNSDVTVAGTGIEQQGWNFFYQVGNTLFVSGYDESKTCQSYTTDPSTGNIIKGGSFVYDDPIQMFGRSADNTTMYAMDNFSNNTNPKTMYLVDATSSAVTKKVTINIDERPDENLTAWATALVQNGDKFFISYHLLLADGSYATPEINTAYIAVYNYSDILNATDGVAVSPEKIITDTRTSHIGTNGFTSSIIRTENGDLYTYSSGAVAAGVNPAATVPSGILKIDNGATDFNPNYFVNITDITGGNNIFWFDYIGNNKAIARIMPDNGIAWNAYTRDATAFNQELYIIDLVAQSATKVEGVPVHAKRYTSPVEVINGKVYVSVEEASKAHVYEIDPSTGQATKGGKIIGKTIKGFYDLAN